MTRRSAVALSAATAVAGVTVGFVVGRGTAWEVATVRVPFVGAECLVRVNRMTGEQRLVTDSSLCRTFMGDSLPNAGTPSPAAAVSP